MDSRIENIINKYANKFVKDLIANYDAMGLRASGDFERGLEIDIKNTKMIIYGAMHSKYMERGRRAGGRPPISAIMRWLDNKKNLPPSMLRNKKQVAFAIATKIAKEGVKVPSKYNSGEVISKVVKGFLLNDVNKMLSELAVYFKKKVTAEVAETLKTA